MVVVVVVVVVVGSNSGRERERDYTASSVVFSPPFTCVLKSRRSEK